MIGCWLGKEGGKLETLLETLVDDCQFVVYYTQVHETYFEFKNWFAVKQNDVKQIFFKVKKIPYLIDYSKKPGYRYL